MQPYCASLTQLSIGGKVIEYVLDENEILLALGGLLGFIKVRRMTLRDPQEAGDVDEGLIQRLLCHRIPICWWATS